MFDVFRKQLQCFRHKAGEYINGIWTEDEEPEEFYIKASVQSVEPEILQILPEGQRSSETYTLFTDYEMKTVDVKLGKKADIVIIDNEKFVVFKVSKMKNLIQPTAHYEVVIIRDIIDEN